MMTTLDKVRVFERYLELTHGQSDQTLDSVLDKLLERKRAELAQQRDELGAELTNFEQRYGMSSADFYAKFEHGELGDAIDFFEWSAAWQMYNSALKYLQVLSAEPTAG